MHNEQGRQRTATRSKTASLFHCKHDWTDCETINSSVEANNSLVCDSSHYARGRWWERGTRHEQTFEISFSLFLLSVHSLCQSLNRNQRKQQLCEHRHNHFQSFRQTPWISRVSFHSNAMLQLQYRSTETCIAWAQPQLLRSLESLSEESLSGSCLPSLGARVLNKGLVTMFLLSAPSFLRRFHAGYKNASVKIHHTICP